MMIFFLAVIMPRFLIYGFDAPTMYAIKDA